MTLPALGTDRADPPVSEFRDSGAGTGTTSTAPRGRDLWRRGRGPALAVLLLVVVSAALAALRGTGTGGELDPGSYAPGGAHAVATLLADRGVAVRVVGDLPALKAELTGGSTVLVARPDLLTDDELRQLGGLDGRLLVAGADAEQVAALQLPVRAEPADVDVRAPGCDLPAAAVAGDAVSGGVSYAADRGTPATGCYAAGGRPTLLTLRDGRTTLLGASEVLSNERLADEGDAALALGLLGAGDQVVWLVPDPGRAAPGDRRSVSELLPDAVRLGALQVAVAVVLLALWRARRLGRVVVEPLPVVVRAAEAVEGRGRLYRLAGARDTAAEALRAAARDRLARRVRLPSGAGRTDLVPVVAARAGRDPREVDDLLHGPPPRDDAGLVRLADALDALVVR